MIQHVKKVFLKNNSYTIAVALLLASSFFGLFREFLLIYIFGFGKINDMLQIYLSLYFVICLVADPVKLVYLNLISLRYLRHIVLCLSSVVCIIIAALVAIMWTMRSELNLSLLGLAAADGFLAILVGLFIFHKQRFGADISTQLVGVIPNFILMPVVITIGLIPNNSYILIFLLAFMCVHIVQLILLTFIKIENDESNKEHMRAVDLMCFARHFISILGDQFFQISISLIFLQIGEGFVTLLSVFIKCLITAKNIVVDSYIGVKIGTWNSHDSIDNFHHLIGNKLTHPIVLFLMFSLCCIDKSNISFMAFQLFFVFLVAFYCTAKYRIFYFQINRHAHYRELTVFMGLFDLFCAFIVYFLSKIDGISHAMIFLFFWYIMRLVVENIVLEKYWFLVCVANCKFESHTGAPRKCISASS